VFTNAGLVDERTVDIFREYPPRNVDVTLYGASARVCDRVTGVQGSFDRTIAGLNRLVDAGVNVTVKTVIMTLNREDFFDIQTLAKSYGSGFRFDPVIFPRLNGDHGVLDLRVPVEEAVALEFATPERAEKWTEYLARSGETALSGGLYGCGVGVSSFYIDPYAQLQPCLMARYAAYDLRKGSFREGWRESMPRLKRKPAPPGYACTSCPERLLCTSCAAHAVAENGREDVPSAYMCALAKERARALGMTFTE